MSRLGKLSVSALLIGSAATPADSDPHREIVRQAVKGYFQSLDTLRGLTYKRISERQEFDAGGALKSRTTWVSISDYVDGVRWTYTVERNGRPVDEPEALMARVRRDVAEWKAQSPSQRGKAIEEAGKRSRRETDYLREFADALEFTPLGLESAAGRPARLFSFSPRPGYKPKSMEGRIYEGVRGKIWIDEAERQMVRLEADVHRDVSVGGFLAKVEKGTRFSLEQFRLEPGLWAPKTQSVRFDLKVLMVRQIHTRIESRFADYRKYEGPRFGGD